MSYIHKEYAAGRWQELSFVEQMANIGSEVSRAMRWREKGKPDLSERAVIRALELLDLTLGSNHVFPRLREVARVREVVVDYFYGDNEYRSSDALWRNYFDHFAVAARSALQRDIDA